jgi:hypothetical protein
MKTSSTILIRLNIPDPYIESGKIKKSVKEKIPLVLYQVWESIWETFFRVKDEGKASKRKV